MTLFQERDPDLVRFARLIRSGEPVPADLAMKLAAEGYDLEALEASVIGA